MFRLSVENGGVLDGDVQSSGRAYGKVSGLGRGRHVQEGQGLVARADR